MRIGVPTEVKVHEYRVAATPSGVHELVQAGHSVLVQEGAGVGSSITDAEYEAAGAKIVAGADDVWAESDMILKVKEPIEVEYPRMRSGQIIFTYLHLAASKSCTDALVKSGATAIAYETVQLANGALPLLAPMSEVAGRMAAQVGAHCLERASGGRGVLMGGVPGVHPANVVVIGAGVSGANAAAMAIGLGANVSILDMNVSKLVDLDNIWHGRLRTVSSNSFEIAKAVKAADLVIGAVLVPGAKAPVLVTDELVEQMKPGSVLVDIAIDQGGCFESSRPTTHADPTFTVANSVFYCVANMPGAVPHTSTYALTNATLHYAVAIANKGWKQALRDDPALAPGLNVLDGKVTCEPVATAHGMDYLPLEKALA